MHKENLKKHPDKQKAHYFQRKNISSETMEGILQCNDIFKVLKEYMCEPLILYPVKIFLKNEDEKKCFQTNKKGDNSSTVNLHEYTYEKKFIRKKNKNPKEEHRNARKKKKQWNR